MLVYRSPGVRVCLGDVEECTFVSLDLYTTFTFLHTVSIKNLNIYFDNSVTLAKELALRGIPTTILFNKEGKEFARVIGSVDFRDEFFLKWIKRYN